MNFEVALINVRKPIRKAIKHQFLGLLCWEKCWESCQTAPTSKNTQTVWGKLASIFKYVQKSLRARQHVGGVRNIYVTLSQHVAPT